MIRAIGVTLLLALSVAACNTVTPNRLSTTDTADLRFTSVEVKFPDTAPLRWAAGDYEYMRARGLTANDPAVIDTPEARIAIREIAARRIKIALDRAIARRPEGTRPVRLVATVKQIAIASPLERVIAGTGVTFIQADVDVIDPRTNAVLTAYAGGRGSQATAMGLTGLVVDAALEAGGRDDLFDRTAEDYAKGFERWLTGP